MAQKVLKSVIFNPEFSKLAIKLIRSRIRATPPMMSIEILIEYLYLFFKEVSGVDKERLVKNQIADKVTIIKGNVKS
jgi:hypothetical protein